MCGIAGYIGMREIPDDRIQRCFQLMDRRGPDNKGIFKHLTDDGRKVCILHSRLSILDLETRSNQPFSCGTGVLAFNGEIYNYLELKDEIEEPYSGWRTSGDTEVLAEVLSRLGTDGLDKCEGMWSLSYYNKADDTLVLSRDRFGEKPLFIWRSNSGLYFGSEIKFLAALNGCWPEMNIEKILQFLGYGFRILHKDNHTFFKGVEMLPQGSVLKVNITGEQLFQYWQPAYKPETHMTNEEAVQGVRERLIRSVELRLRADVPLAFCMSGGVDSNGLISIAKKILGHDVHGFTFTTEDSRYDEMELINRSVSDLGLRHTVVKGDSKEFLANLQELVRYHDCPVSTVTWYANWMLMKSIAAYGYKIAINGIAADELFSGYFDHHLAYFYEIRTEKQFHDDALANWRREILPQVRNPFLRDPDLFIRNPEFRDHHYLQSDIFVSRLKTNVDVKIAEKKYTGDLLRNRMFNELFHENVPVYMHEEDLNAMYYSIENRTPYLDRNLFEFCNTVPTRHLIRNGRAKSILRDCLRGITPDPVLDCSKKVGFNAPIMSFLDTSDTETMEYLLDDGPIYEYIHKDAIRRLCVKKNLPNSESKFLFAFLNCKIFLENFN